MSKRNILCLGALLALVTLVYANHFHNDFHFDDSHAVVSNPYIRDLRNLPRILTDPDTFSTLPANRSWRPVVTASLAIDYWLAGGLKPVVFQASTFFWFLVQIALMYGLFLKICNLTRPDPHNHWVALFAAALYGLHPAMAETVNYVIQRGDVYSTLGVVAGIFLYAWKPRWRDYGVYLLPVLLALLSKPPALVFPAILFCWIVLFEDEKPLRALRKCVPALVLAGAFAILANAMTPATYTPGAGSASAYRITQPLVALRYFGAFFLPTHLSADTDHTAIPTILDPGAAAGFLFLLAVLAVAVWCSKARELRPIAFGLYWFVLALVPTSIFPLAEVENDHRMFFPFVGLSLAVCWAAAVWLYSHRVPRALVATACALVLAVAAWGTVQRNRVWKSEETLWRDVAAKSPRNGRGLMNYGLTLMGRGDFKNALDLFTRALVYNPNYMVLEVNIGIDNGALGNDAEAERHFTRALQLSPAEAVPNYFYAVWLHGKGRSLEALQRLNVAVTNNPSYLDAQYLLMQIYADLHDPADLRKTAMNTLAVSPSDPTAQSWLARAGNLPPAAPQQRSPEDWVTISLALYQQGKYEDSINAAREALKLRPAYAIPWNNIAAGYNQLGKWDEGIHAAQEAIRLDPNFQLAKNNLAWAQSEKQKHASR